MLRWIIEKFIGSQNQRQIKRLLPVVAEINRHELALQSLSDAQLQAKTDEFKDRLARGETLDDLLPEAYAVVKNTCRRFTERKRVVHVRGTEIVWEMIPFDVQLIGAIALHRGFIAEMATGEGKTLVATMPTYLNALAGKGVHIVTVNDYLAARDAEWMGEIYRFLGLTVGCLQHGQTPAQRREQYACDISYGTSSEFGFDYLRDNGLATSVEEQVQRGHFFAIIDEVDSILIDEARTPLIISGPSTVSTHQYDKFKGSVQSLVRKQTELCNRLADEARREIEAGNLTAAGSLLVKIKMGMPRHKQLLKAMEDPEVRRAVDTAEVALYQDTRRTDLYRMKEELYFSIDEKTHEADLSQMGRDFLAPGNPDYFTMPDIITLNHDIDSNPALDDAAKARERQKVQALYEETSQRIHNISQLLRAYCVYERDVHYVVENNKVVIVDENTGRPMYGRRWSDGLHQAIEAKEGVQIDRETQTMATITVQNYFRLYERLAGMTGTAETEANEFRDIYRLGVLVIPTNRPCQRKDGDDLIYKTRREKLNAVIQDIKERHSRGQPVLVGTVSVESSEVISRMLRRENIPHNVLNAKYHQQEAEIIARAGQRGAVTIATNMAGRGTDIKLGPGVAELGGLHVIGTERHESRRIDRQLRGRCARQGDPGSSQFYISFEDDLMRNFGDSRRMAGLMTRLGMQDEEGLSHPWLNRTVENAQKRVEQRNYIWRKHTLQYDDVMNQQRLVIYSLRNDILTADDPRTEIYRVVDEVIENECRNFLGDRDARDPEGLLHWLNTTMPLGLTEKDLLLDGDIHETISAIKKQVRQAYELKMGFENPATRTALERFVILGAIDRLWQEHLYAMDSLRQSITLRAFGQKDPLIEYKQEAYTMFEQLMAAIQREIVQNMFRSATSLQAVEDFLRSLPRRMVHDTSSPGLNADSSAPALSTPSARPTPEAPPLDLELPIQRHVVKIGRNDRVTIRRGNETQTLKYKKAEPLLQQGWELVDHDRS